MAEAVRATIKLAVHQTAFQTTQEAAGTLTFVDMVSPYSMRVMRCAPSQSYG